MAKIHSMTSSQQDRLFREWGFMPAGHKGGHAIYIWPETGQKVQATAAGRAATGSPDAMRKAARIVGVSANQFLQGPPSKPTQAGGLDGPEVVPVEVVSPAPAAPPKREPSVFEVMNDIELVFDLAVEGEFMAISDLNALLDGPAVLGAALRKLKEKGRIEAMGRGFYRRPLPPKEEPMSTTTTKSTANGLAPGQIGPKWPTPKPVGAFATQSAAIRDWVQRLPNGTRFTRIDVAHGIGLDPDDKLMQNVSNSLKRLAPSAKYPNRRPLIRMTARGVYERIDVPVITKTKTKYRKRTTVKTVEVPVAAEGGWTVVTEVDPERKVFRAPDGKLVLATLTPLT